LATDIANKYDCTPDLIPSGGGVFEVEVNGNLIFSKRAEDRFPDHDEIFAGIEKHL